MEIQIRFQKSFCFIVPTFGGKFERSKEKMRGYHRENQVAGMAVVANIHNRAFEYKDVLSLLLCTTRVKNSTWEFQGEMPSQNES